MNVLKERIQARQQLDYGFSYKRIGFRSLLLIFSLVLLLSFSTASLAADATSQGYLSVSFLNQQLKIIAPYSGDDNANNTLLIEWDEDGGDWETLLGSNQFVHSANPYAYTISGLTNGALYQVRLTWQDADNSPVEQVRTQTGLTPYDPHVHNSLSTGSPKWGGSWGVANKQYGEFTCQTCHGKGSANIKFIKETITTPDGSAWSGPADTSVSVSFTDTQDGVLGFGDDSDGHLVSDRACEVCHSQNKFHNYNVADNSGGDTSHYNGEDCIFCHRHNDGFRHGGNGTGCETCHGHDANYEYSPGEFSAGSGSFLSHSTHTEGDADDLKGPILGCGTCHDVTNFPYFKDDDFSGVPLSVDFNGDGKLNLAETNVCDRCHSIEGPVNGVVGAAVGAKDNWDTGVYTGESLTAGKELWCISCHDSGRSTLGGYQAPDVAGDNDIYGYYQSGHGAFALQCDACHGLTMSHNFDGKKTYAEASNNYKDAYRLIDVGGQDPMNIPGSGISCATYTPDNYRLCFSCHSEEALLSDTRAAGAYGCTSNPYKSAASITTGFRNTDAAGYGAAPTNIHWDHLADANSSWWHSEGPNQGTAFFSCPTCHNPHGDALGGNATKRMTHSDFEIVWGSDGVGDYGQVGAGGSYDDRCSVACHAVDTKYYRGHPPTLDSISLADNDSADPAAANTGYTNSQSVTVTLSNSGTTPTHMQFAEDFGFSSNVTGWVAFNSTYTYALSAGEGSKTVYGKIKSGDGQSASLSATIVVDGTDPVVGSSALTAPNGAETWIQDASENIIWTPGEISDANLKDSPVSLAYSTDSGSSFPNEIASDEANDGTYPWSVAVEETATVQVQLIATDKAGNQGSDQSDVDFTIDSVTPVLASISLADNNSADPAAAEVGYSNSQSVAVTLSVAKNPTQMMLAEDSGFSVNSTGWIAFNSSYNYDLTAGDGTRTVYGRVKNGAGESGDKSNTIILDTLDPDIQTDTLSVPNGHATRYLADFWEKGSSEAIAWDSTDISDLNLSVNPIYISYSADSGTTWSKTLASAEANDGSYDWNITEAITHYSRIRIAARDKAGNEGTDDSDNDFNVSPPFIITNTNDSGAGSYYQTGVDSQAIINSAVWFNIPAGLLTNGVAVINRTTAEPWIWHGTVIDGTSQTVLRGDTNPNGPEIRVHKAGGSVNKGLAISGRSVTVRGMQFTGFSTGIFSMGDDTAIESCQFGFYSNSLGYGSGPNIVDLDLDNIRAIVNNGNYSACSNYGIMLSGSDALIANNTFGRYPNGTLCANGTAVYVGGVGMNAQILDNILLSSGYGITMNSSAGDAVIQGNQIGVVYEGGSWTDVAGPVSGIRINTGGRGHLIGGPSVASSDTDLRDSNVIGANTNGIWIEDSQDSATDIHGNFIGTNPEQDEVFTGSVGLRIGAFNGLAVGGSGADEAGNVIANMNQYGITFDSVGNYSDYHKFSRNSFYNNGDDTADDAIYLNTDGNGAIDRPVIESVTTTTLSVSNVSGGWDAPSADTVEVFLADFGGTEYGEGKTFITSAVVPIGEITLDVDISGAGISYGDWVTVTTTGPYKGTSAFSANVRLSGPAVPTLTWTGESNYTTDGVDPDSGAQLGNFTFRVEYTDIDNDSPWPIEVWIDADDNDTYAADEKFSMTAVDSGDVDYTDGKLYTYSMILPYTGDGILKYRFNASDARSAATGTPAADKTVTVVNAAPDTPAIATPTNGEIDVPQPIVLTASAFVDADAADTHQSSQWLLSSVSGAAFIDNLLYDSGANEASNLHVPAVSVTKGTTCYWKVRYQDQLGSWSAYSAEASFTLIDNVIPNTPVHISPAAGAVDVDRQPTLSAEAFLDTDVGDTHLGSVWQVSTASGDDFVSGIVHNSGIVAASTSYVVPVLLDLGQVYYWRARYQDDKEQWSALSADTMFTTTSVVTMYHFEEGSGTVASDSVGSNDGTIRNGTTWTTGYSGQGLLFDGVDDDVIWSYAAGKPANDFAIEAMVKATTTHQISAATDLEATVGTGGTSGQKYLFEPTFAAGTDAGAGISMGTNGISVYEHSAGYMPPLAVYDPAAKSPMQPQLGTGWNHVVISYSDKQPRIYLNGVQVHTGLTSLKTNVFAPTWLGRGGYGAFAGTVDEVAIHGKALTQTEVRQRCIDVGPCASLDLDNDTVIDNVDNCVLDYNPDQADLDADGVGNVCDYVGLWMMNNVPGSSSAIDETGNNDGTISGTAFFDANEGVAGTGGLKFQGTTQVSTVPNVLNNRTGDFSISAWLKFPTGAINPTWSLGKGTPWTEAGFGVAHWVTADAPVPPGLYLNDGTEVFNDPVWEYPHRISLYASSIPRGTWGHFVWTIDRTNHVMKVYKNGQYESQIDISILGTNALSDGSDFHFGQANANNYYYGSMDNVALYDFVLQPGDVQARCEADSGVGNCP